jgi:hypothetical protein
MCEETKCDWKCKKPTLCPRPKCELVCEKPACEFKKPEPVANVLAAMVRNGTLASSCCACNQANIAMSMLLANKAMVEEGSSAQPEVMPSLLELSHTFKHQTQEGQQPCCACGTQ